MPEQAGAIIRAMQWLLRRSCPPLGRHGREVRAVHGGYACRRCGVLTAEEPSS